MIEEKYLETYETPEAEVVRIVQEQNFVNTVTCENDNEPIVCPENTDDF